MGSKGDFDQAMMSNHVPFQDTEELGPAAIRKRCFGADKSFKDFARPKIERKARDSS